MQKRHWTNGDTETQNAERTEIRLKWRKSIQHIVATWTFLSIVSESLYFFFVFFFYFYFDIYHRYECKVFFNNKADNFNGIAFIFRVFFSFQFEKKHTTWTCEQIEKHTARHCIFSHTDTLQLTMAAPSDSNSIMIHWLFRVHSTHRCVCKRFYTAVLRDNCSILVFKK